MNNKCKSCNGKGFHTQMKGEICYPDFFGQKLYKSETRIQKNKCRHCGRQPPSFFWKIKAKINNFFYDLTN